MRASQACASAVVLTLCLVGVAAAAGVVVEHQQREPDSQAVTGRVTYYLDAGRLRIESQTEDGDQTMIIFRAEEPVAWSIDQTEGVYVEITPAEVERLRQQMEQGRKQMEEALKQMPPEQREAMEQMMGQMGTMMAEPEPAVVRVVGQGESVGSFVCTHYEVTRGGRRESEVWAAPITDMKIQPAEYETMIDLAQLFEPLSQAMPVGQLGELAALDNSEQAIEGFPVRTLTYVEGRAVSEEIITRAAREDFNAELFELPQGLRKREFGEEF